MRPWLKNDFLWIDQAVFNMPNVANITPQETIGREVIPEIANL